jgi:hypothetical protein
VDGVVNACKVVIVAAAGLASPQVLIDAQRQEYLQSLRELNDPSSSTWELEIAAP